MRGSIYVTGYVAGRGRGMGDLARSQQEGGFAGKEKEADRDQGDYSESNFDEFSGYGGAVSRYNGQ